MFNTFTNFTAADAAASGGGSFIWTLLLIGVIMFFFLMLRRGRGGPPSGNGSGSIGSQFTRGTNDRSFEMKSTNTFADVAGCEEAIKKLKRVKRWLKNPNMYKMFGAKLPKGVLMVCPPGTGKTLLARALAGEAGASFIIKSGSDFVEIFVGQGAARVREMFASARALVQKTGRPCIVFIDEIDAVGKKRSGGGPASNDERDQTLNAILVEMDGFAPNMGILVIAATNRADILDPALKRPGRFDYQVPVDLPDMKGREAIFGVHMRGKPVAKGIDMRLLAKRSPGMSGADIMGVCNEAATLAGERYDEMIVKVRAVKTEEEVKAIVKPHLYIEAEKLDKLLPELVKAAAIAEEVKSQDALKELIKDHVGITLKEFDEAVDIVRMGEAKVSLTVSPEQQMQTAVHEWGHLAVKKHKGGRVTKVTIMPRMNALGYTESAPEENQLNLTKEDMWMHILMCMGGRAAQKILLKTEDTGAQNDFEQASRYARMMITKFGFSDLGPISIDEQEMANFGGSQFVGEELKTEINRRYVELLKKAQQEAEAIIEARRGEIMRGAKYMVEVNDTMLEPEIDMVWNGDSMDTKAPAAPEAAAPSTETVAKSTDAEIKPSEPTVQPDAAAEPKKDEPAGDEPNKQ